MLSEVKALFFRSELFCCLFVEKVITANGCRICVESSSSNPEQGGERLLWKTNK